MAKNTNKVVCKGETLIDLTDDSATAGTVLSGSTFHDKTGTKVTGTMPNIGTVATTALTAGGSYTIPAGYHNGSGKVTAATLASQTSATANAGHILTGVTAWVNGSKITGTMPSRGAVSASINAGESYTIPSGNHNGSGKVTANSLASQTPANADAAKILNGYNAWVDGVKVSGTMTNNGALAVQGLPAGKSYTIPAGYHNGSGTVSTLGLTVQTGGTATAGHIVSGKTAWVGGKQLTGTLNLEKSTPLKTYSGVLNVNGTFAKVNIQQALTNIDWHILVITGFSWITTSSSTQYWNYSVILGREVDTNSRTAFSGISNRLHDTTGEIGIYEFCTNSTNYFYETPTTNYRSFTFTFSTMKKTLRATYSASSTSPTELLQSFAIAKGKSVTIPYDATYADTNYEVSVYVVA